MPLKVGISLPEQYHKSSIRTPQYFYGLSNDQQYGSKNKEQSDDIDNDSNSLTYIQIGNPEPVPFIQLCNNKIPELPVKTRSRVSTANKSRPSTAIKTYKYNYNSDTDKEKKPGLTMKYFGESGNVIGCFTAAKIPIQSRRPSTATKPRKGTISLTPRKGEDLYRRFNGI